MHEGIVLTQYLTHDRNIASQNVVVTYSGMFIGGDYVFEMKNFIGINMR